MLANFDGTGMQPVTTYVPRKLRRYFRKFDSRKFLATMHEITPSEAAANVYASELLSRSNNLRLARPEVYLYRPVQKITEVNVTFLTQNCTNIQSFLCDLSFIYFDELLNCRMDYLFVQIGGIRYFYFFQITFTNEGNEKYIHTFLSSTLLALFYLIEKLVKCLMIHFCFVLKELIACASNGSNGNYNFLSLRISDKNPVNLFKQRTRIPSRPRRH